MRFAQTVGKLVVSSIGAAIVQLIAVTIFGRSLGAATLGVFFLFQSVATMSVSVGDLGQSTAIEKRSSSGSSRGAMLGAGIFSKLVIITIATPIIWFNKSLIEEYVGAPAAPSLILLLVVWQFVKLFRGTIKGALRVEQTAVFNVLQKAIWFFAGLILLHYEFGALGLIYALVLSYTGVLILAIRRVEFWPSIPSWSDIRSLNGYASWAYVGSIGGLVYNWMDVLFIGYFLSTAAVGAYEVAWMLTTVTLLFSQAVRQAAFPLVNAEGSLKKIDRIESLIFQFVTPSLYFVIPAFFGIIILGDDILSVVFGVEFAVGVAVLGVLMLEKMQQAVAYVLIAPMHAINRPDLAAKSTAVGIVTNLVLNLILIPEFGLVGAALGTLLGQTANFGTHTWYLKKFMRIPVPVRELSICTVAAIVMGTVVYWYKMMIDSGSLLSLASAVAVGAVIYILLTSISSRMRDRMRMTIGKVSGT